MGWTLYNQDFVQWVDGYAADAWFREAQRLASAAELERLSTRPYSEQAAHVRAAVTALSQGYRALTLPAYPDPAFREAWAKYFGTQGYGRQGENRYQVESGLLWRDAGEVLTALGEHPDSRRVIVRNSLDEDSLPVEVCTDDGTGEGECGFSGLFTGCGNDMTRTTGCDPYNWNSIRWRGGWTLLAAEGNAVVVLPPLWWSMRWVRDVADACVRRGWLGTLEQTRVNVALLNAGAARRLLGPGAMDRQLAAATANIPVDLETARWSASQTKLAGGALIALGSTIAAAGGPPGIIAGAIVGSVGAIIGMLPGAVGVATDRYGRPEIVTTDRARGLFEKSWVAGTGPGDNQRPTYNMTYPAGTPIPLPTIGISDAAALITGATPRVLQMPGLARLYPGVLPTSMNGQANDVIDVELLPSRPPSTSSPPASNDGITKAVVGGLVLWGITKLLGS